MRDLIREVFESKFEEEKYSRFISELLVDYDREKYFLHNTSFPEMFRDFVSSFTRLGTYHSPAGETIDSLIVYLKNSRSVESARNAHRNFVAHHLKKRENKDAALVAFVSPGSPDWRFSLVRSTLENIKQESGKFKLTQTFSPAKRWSYLVGENERSHTAQSMFLPLMEKGSKPVLDELVGAFDIESVTDEFFESYKELFFRVKDAIDNLTDSDRLIREEFEMKGIKTADFSKKLLGQVVFLYFLQKKGWLGVEETRKWGTGSKRFLRDLFEMKHTRYRNFFNDVLEHLFYEALASDRSIYNHFSTLFNCRLPFLNGGLFDPIGGYNWSQTHILLPDGLFSNSEKTKQGDSGTGILDVFDRYNFTVKEDEPLEKEVAVDPEMLGKVFENLLEVNDRKSTGTFYTPRSVVYYMCQESIVRYLEPHLKHAITDDEIRDFIRLADYGAEKEAHVSTLKKETDTYSYQTPECIRKNAKLIDDLLAKVKVCDPAIGSGAFPVGILSEIVKLRMMLTPFLEEKEGRTAYNFKRHCIQNSIYGVDISAGAVEIAKLRLWLSLVVDEDNADDVKPLPNLDYKIVTGNSLLRVQENLFEAVDDKTFQNMKITFFNETNSDKKKAEKEKIDRVIEQMAGGVDAFDFPLYFSEVFSGDNPGFDVVIGNPPYIQLQKLKGTPEHALYKEQGFDTYEATGDIYCLFYERGIKILKKDEGILSYITSNKWMRAGYGAKLRDFLVKRDPLVLIDFSGVKVFKSATVDTNVLILRNSSNSKQLLGATAGKLKVSDSIQEFFNSEKARIEVLPGESWNIGTADEQLLKAKIEKLGTPLKEWGLNIYRGVLTGLNEAFFIDQETRDRLVAEDPRSAEIIKPLLRGRDIKGYGYDWDGLYLIATFPALNLSIDDYPAVRRQLLSFGKSRLEQQGKTLPDGSKSRKLTGNKWFETQDQIAYYGQFQSPKIMYPNMTKFLPFYYDTKGFYSNDKSFIISGPWLLYLTGFLNSNIFRAVYRDNFPELLGGTRELRKIFFEQLKIPHPSKLEKEFVYEFENLVSQRNDEKDHIRAQSLENQIDLMLYRLFQLSEDEIKFIESKASEIEG